jgi:hypothetical protein
MMFLFGTPLENATWLVAPGLRFTANSLFRGIIMMSGSDRVCSHSFDATNW